MPTFFILDEFANIGQIPDFDKKISTSRSRGISFSVILQNLDQLEAVYEKSYETIMGNCDTHVFLGSNSYKTVEYFSKALGEKTITRESLSVNRDKQFHRQGYSDSDQVMARALMTPDELRRMDNDLCIIYEKGLKPIKDEKYYYFETPMARKLSEVTLNHLEFETGDRGKWRKFNPYNPYVEGSEEKANDLKVDSLDDLFEEDDKKEESEKKAENTETVEVGKTAKAPEVIQPNTTEIGKVEEEAPILPQDVEENTRNNEDIMSMDVQKELEAKFDELFGSFDEDDNK